MNSNFFPNTERSEISGGDYFAARDSPATFFENGKELRITGGRYGTVGGTDTSQSSSSNATRSSTEGRDGDSYPARPRQSTRKSEAYQDNLAPYESRERKVSSASILETNQVENDPESYGSDTDQPTQSSHSSRSPASAWRPNASPPSNKGSSGSRHGARGARSDKGGSSTKFQTTPGSPPHTNAHAPALRTNTAPAPSKKSTHYVPHGGANPPSSSPSPPPLPPKPDELKQKMSTDMGPRPTGRNPPPSLSMDQVKTGAGGYPSPGSSPPRDHTTYHSPQVGSPDAWSHDYSPPFPVPQHPASHDATQGFGYPSPKTSPQDKEPHRGGSHPLRGPSSQTPHVPHGHPYPVNMNWQKSEPPATSSHGPPPFTGHAPQVTRAATMPVPVFYSPTGTTTTTSQNPYRSQYPPPAQYDASMRHGGQPSYSIPMPTPQPSNYPRAHDNYYQGQPPSRRDGPPFPHHDYQNRSNPPY